MFTMGNIHHYITDSLCHYQTVMSYLLVRTGDFANVAGKFDCEFAFLSLSIHFFRSSAEGSTLTAALNGHFKWGANTLNPRNTTLVSFIYEIKKKSYIFIIKEYFSFEYIYVLGCTQSQKKILMMIYSTSAALSWSTLSSSSCTLAFSSSA